VISPRLANVVIIIVTIVWVTSFAVSLFSLTYKPDPQINVIFMAITGGAMALKAKRGEGGPPSPPRQAP
jgi:nicotinamide riboside transporter PnuC